MLSIYLKCVELSFTPMGYGIAMPDARPAQVVESAPRTGKPTKLGGGVKGGKGGGWKGRRP